eukprot:10551812-Karenia_brevis.AAC.1
MVVASAKEPGYDSSMEDPIHIQWCKVVEPIIVPKGDDGKPRYNHIYPDHICDPPVTPHRPGGHID